MMRKIKRTPDDLDELLQRDREDEMHDWWNSQRRILHSSRR